MDFVRICNPHDFPSVSNNKLMEIHAAISSSGKAEERDIPGVVWRSTTTRLDGERESENIKISLDES
ncbi:MAG: hypothetical protein LBL35_00170 [Clostridiales bacterium]|nr:hypothetical protein [Clostridiales bacterium]